MSQRLLWRRGWTKAHVDRGNGFTRCGRITEGASEPPLMSNTLVCERCSIVAKRPRGAASVGIYCQRCHAHVPLAVDGSFHAGQLAAFRRQHLLCEWRIEK